MFHLTATLSGQTLLITGTIQGVPAEATLSAELIGVFPLVDGLPVTIAELHMEIGADTPDEDDRSGEVLNVSLSIPLPEGADGVNAVFIMPSFNGDCYEEYVELDL